MLSAGEVLGVVSIGIVVVVVSFLSNALPRGTCAASCCPFSVFRALLQYRCHCLLGLAGGLVCNWLVLPLDDDAHAFYCFRQPTRVLFVGECVESKALFDVFA